MRRIHTTSQGFGPDSAAADPAVVRLCASYLLGRWAQAPISLPVREADT
ncbi:MAG TPA: hypothetical protein VGA70_06050 [Longimicrobiales bacterium]|jgi:hypothetical protein